MKRAAVLLALVLACATPGTSIDAAHVALVEGGGDLVPFLESDETIADVDRLEVASAYVYAAAAVADARSAVRMGRLDLAELELAGACDQVQTLAGHRAMPGVERILEGLAPACGWR